jgi:hypothetical protein
MKTQIITKQEINALTPRLNLLSGNLLGHAFQSLSKAHCIQVMAQEYRDSGGVLLSDHVIRIVVNNTPYYVPAHTTSLAGQTQAVVIDKPDKPTDLGDATLITSFDEDATGAAGETADLATNNILLAHAGNNADEVHGDLQFISRTIVNSDGWAVGRGVIRISFGGALYDMPCDMRPQGPPVLPQITLQPASVVRSNGKAASDGGFDIFDPSFGHGLFSGDSGRNQSPVAMKVIAVGDPNLLFQWQVTKENNSGWIDLGTPMQLTDPVTAKQNVASFTTKYTRNKAKFFPKVYVDGTWPTSSVTPVNCYLGVSIHFPDDEDHGTFNPAAYFRCKITSSATNETVYSNVTKVVIRRKDADSGWFF